MTCFAGRAGFAPALLFLLGEVSGDRIDEVRQAAPDNFFPHNHPIFFRDAPGLHILRPNERNQVINWQVSKSVLTAGAGGFCRQSLSPEITPHVIPDLDFPDALYLLNGQAAVANEFAARLQNHCPKPVAVRLVTPPLAGDPLFDSRTIEMHGIVAHSLRVGENEREGVGVGWNELTQY